MGTSEIRQLLGGRGWLAEQPEELQQAILERVVQRTFRDGEHVYSIGDDPGGAHALLTGMAKIYHESADGKAILMKVLKPGDWFGMVSMFDELPLPHYATISGTTKILTLTKSGFEEIIRKNPFYLKNFAGVMCENMRLAMGRLADLGTLTPAQRLAKLLLNAGLGGLDDEANPTLDLSQTDMCSLINASRATVNKLLKDWGELGWIDYRYRRIQIRNAQSLMAVLKG
jgi:CRP-like cAMP-binding protein